MNEPEQFYQRYLQSDQSDQNADFNLIKTPAHCKSEAGGRNIGMRNFAFLAMLLTVLDDNMTGKFRSQWFWDSQKSNLIIQTLSI